MIANSNELHNNHTDRGNSLALIEDAEDLCIYKMQPLIRGGHWTETYHLENPVTIWFRWKTKQQTLQMNSPCSRLNLGPEMEETFSCLEKDLLQTVLIAITRDQYTSWAVDGRQSFNVVEAGLRMCFLYRAGQAMSWGSKSETGDGFEAEQRLALKFVPQGRLNNLAECWWMSQGFMLQWLVELIR